MGVKRQETDLAFPPFEAGAAMLPSVIEADAFGAQVQAHLGVSSRGDGEFFRRKLQAVSAALSMPTSRVLARLAERDPTVWRTVTELVPNSETSLFRDLDQLHSIVSAFARPGFSRNVRLLSVGCATGEELHSLAMLVFSRLDLLWGRTPSLMGVDVSPTRIARAQSGQVSASAVAKVTRAPSQWPSRFVRAEGDLYRVREHLRSMETFGVANLFDPDSLTALGQFEVVVCRNVLIYFTPADAALALDRLKGLVKKGGALFLGAAESALLASLPGGHLEVDGAWWREVIE
jgi:chemotaxis protein methyltransferase CheR